MIVRQVTVYRLLAVANFIVIALGLQSAFTATGGNDANAVAKLAAEGDFDLGGYGATAYVYAIIPDAFRQVFVLFIGSLFVAYSMRRLQTNLHAMIILFLTLAPSILTVASFQKDLLLVPFIICASCALGKFSKGLTISISISIIYAIYGISFRSYYLLILFFFLFILAFRSISLQWRFPLLLGIALIIMTTPLPVLQALQEPRDMVNYYRMNTQGAVGARTAFVNLLPVEGTLSFVVNYLYAFARLNFAFFINPGIREAFLQINVIIYIFTIYYAFRFGGPFAKNAASLLLAHMIVQTFFEPDLGSYIRHLSSTLPFAAIPIIECFINRPRRVAFTPKVARFTPHLDASKKFLS